MKKCIHIIYFQSLGHGVTNLFMMISVLVTCINKVNFLFFFLFINYTYSQILKEDMINQLKRMWKERRNLVYTYIICWHLPASTDKTTINRQKPRQKLGPLEYRAKTQSLNRDIRSVVFQILSIFPVRYEYINKYDSVKILQTLVKNSGICCVGSFSWRFTLE